MYQPNQRVQPERSEGHRDYRSAGLGDAPVYLVELLFSFKGVKRVEVPEEHIHSM